LFEAFSLSSTPLALTPTGSMPIVDRLEGACIPSSPYLVVIGTKSSKSCPSLLMGIAPFFSGSDFGRVCSAAVPVGPPLYKDGKHCWMRCFVPCLRIAGNLLQRFGIVACPFKWILHRILPVYDTAVLSKWPNGLELWIGKSIQ
jgi:hypothetical protein